jgi:hypothetical protein
VLVRRNLCVRGHCVGATSSLCYARRWRVDLLGYPHPLDARDDATSALSRNGTTQADPSRNLETTRLTSSGGREPATGTTRPKFIDPWLDHHGGPRKLPPESGLGLCIDRAYSVQRRVLSGLRPCSPLGDRRRQPRRQAAAPVCRLPLQFAEIVAVFTHLSDHAVVYGAQDSDLFEMTRA